MFSFVFNYMMTGLFTLFDVIFILLIITGPLSERNICGDLLGDVLTSRTSIFWNDDDDEDDDDDDDDEEEDGSRRNVEMDAIRKTLERERKCAQLHHGR